MWCDSGRWPALFGRDLEPVLQRLGRGSGRGLGSVLESPWLCLTQKAGAESGAAVREELAAWSMRNQ